MQEQQAAGIRRTVIGVIIFVALVVSGFVWRMHQPVIMSDRELRANGAIVLNTPRIFSDFELIDHHGDTFDLSRLQGKWSVLFFGFSNCPDVCPTTLAVLNDMYGKLREGEQEKIQVVMVSLDPERDTEEKLSQYVPYFNETFTGVTGNPHLIKRLAYELNIAYNKVPLGEENYTVDHSTQLVLVNPKGHYHGFFKAPHNEMILRKTWRSISATFEK